MSAYRCLDVPVHLLRSAWSGLLWLVYGTEEGEVVHSMSAPSPTSKQVEVWLQENQEWFEDYFLKNGSKKLVQKWIESHKGEMIGSGPNNFGLKPALSPSTQRRVTYAQLSNNKSRTNSQSEEKPDNNNEEVNPIRPRSGSRQYLRQDFAKARSRTLFNTWASPSPAGMDNEDQDQDTGPTSPRDPSNCRRGQLRRASTVPPERHSISMLSLLLEPKVRLPHRTSITNEAKLELRSTDERQFFLTLVKDISHDLDLDSLRDKITTNVGILVNSERTSLFLLEGPKGREMLVCKPHRLAYEREFNNGGKGVSWQDGGIMLSPGEGFVGRVAETGQTLRIESPGEISHVKDVETLIGLQVRSVLCLPIRNSEDDIIGVCQVSNKILGSKFTEHDEKLMETYLTFCGIGINNAQLFETYMKEYDRNRKLLEVAHDLFEEQTCLDNVVQKIMQRAQSLLKCERCSVMLVKDPTAETITFSKVFDLPSTLHNGHSNNTVCSGDVKLSNGIIEHVAATGDTLNIYDAQNDPRFDKELDKATGFHTRSILCMPIRDNKYQIIGVAQILNRTDGFPFDENDEQLFEAFTIFCGLGINNTLMYNEIAKAMARQKVALEVLSYHACSTSREVEDLKISRLPQIQALGMTRFDFDDFKLDTDEMVKASLRLYMDLGLLQKFKIDPLAMTRFLLTVRKNYRPVAYHNFRHAFNVQQAMFAVLQNTSVVHYLTEPEQLSLLVGCLCHDLDHRGTNNAFQQKSQSPLSQLYGSKATMEYHHFNHTVMILSSQGHNIFANMPAEQYSEVMNVLKHAILATDLALHFKVRSQFFDLVRCGRQNWRTPQQKELLRGMLMTACDVAASTKPWRIQHKIAELVTSEFFDQGDKERNELKIEPTTMFDRNRKDELPQMQLGFIDGVCLPLYESLVKVSPMFTTMLEGVRANRKKWNELNEQRKRKKSTSEISKMNIC
ncbi:dual 3',5'-cyclic-AMP and -GMP phosphodiesterase 11A-like [Acanthaster planci]|uniref:Phosphodiesterase n=1 Tax=Acanthaster planci TaxID=133434 RepID=A0A8B7Z6V8_ACAPL|nr:dual 3',5'-cyclic-AMP and -GMP phosphodiesterase 11A-like [Acanthaster planci]